MPSTSSRRSRSLSLYSLILLYYTTFAAAKTFQHSNMDCNINNKHCRLICNKSNLCTNIQITCPANYICDITCKTFESCYNTIINATHSTYLKLNTNTLSNSGLTIYFPAVYNNPKDTPRSNINDNPMNNNNNINISTLKHLPLTFYTINGWNDINSNSNYHKYNGIIHCSNPETQMQYSQSCPFKHSCCNKPTPIAKSKSKPQRNLLQATSYRTLSGGVTWYDDYKLVPPESMGWTVKNENNNDVGVVTPNSYGSFYHGAYKGDTDLSMDKYYIIQQFKCDTDATVTIKYFACFCNTENSDYITLYLNGVFQVTTNLNDNTGTAYDDNMLEAASGCSQWEFFYYDSLYSIPFVAADALWSVHFEIGVNYYNDAAALSGIELLCTPQPTASPTYTTYNPTTNNPTTANPTLTPTANPTPAPTALTANPTTLIPTSSPTPSPTGNPTPSPTPAPTKNPTPSPTNNPTPSPTPAPTNNPTPSPTPAPTKNPTPSPTKNPTPSPTNNPTPSPTNNPTPSPTSQPTPSPTNMPTKIPSQMPSVSPTETPTINTNAPSTPPTNAPTFSPTRPEGAIGDITGTSSVTSSDDVEPKLTQNGNDDGWLESILFMALGFGVITCIVLAVWYYFYKLKQRKRKAMAMFTSNRKFSNDNIEMQPQNGENAAVSKKKNKIKYSPFTGQTSPDRIQNPSLHQHIITDMQISHVQSLQTPYVDTFMLDATQNNNNNFAHSGNFSGGHSHIQIGGMSPLSGTMQNPMMFAQSLQNENLVNDIMLDDAVQDMAQQTPMGGDDVDVGTDDEEIIGDDITNDMVTPMDQQNILVDDDTDTSKTDTTNDDDDDVLIMDGVTIQ